MPEMTFTVRWPDGVVIDCYSPSLVMHDHLTVGAVYPLADFVRRAVVALDEASARVQDRFGFVCTSAMQQREEILERAAGYGGAGTVVVVAMTGTAPA